MTSPVGDASEQLAELRGRQCAQIRTAAVLKGFCNLNPIFIMQACLGQRQKSAFFVPNVLPSGVSQGLHSGDQFAA